jgi:hypothetical protein
MVGHTADIAGDKGQRIVRIGTESRHKLVDAVQRVDVGLANLGRHGLLDQRPILFPALGGRLIIDTNVGGKSPHDCPIRLARKRKGLHGGSNVDPKGSCKAVGNNAPANAVANVKQGCIDVEEYDHA